MAIIAVVNTSGNVGKTLISREVIHEALPETETKAIIEVETINTSTYDMNFPGVELRRFSGDEVEDIYQETMFLDNSIIDVGASNFVPFVRGLSKLRDFVEEIDVFLVPISVQSGKQIADGISTVKILVDLGVRDKILVVFNHVDSDVRSAVGENFIETMRKLGVDIDFDCAISSHGVVGILENAGKTSKDLTEDSVDYKSIAKKYARSGNKEKAKRASSQHIAKLGATSFREESDRVFSKIRQRMIELGRWQSRSSSLDDFDDFESEPKRNVETKKGFSDRRIDENMRKEAREEAEETFGALGNSERESQAGFGEKEDFGFDEPEKEEKRQNDRSRDNNERVSDFIF